MHYPTDLKRPTKEERRLALESYEVLVDALDRIKSENPEIEIEETGERIRIPALALKLLVDVLKATSQGKPVSIIPVATEMTTQAAAEFLGCSRPHVVKLLEEGQIPYSKVGKHRRLRFEHLIDYKEKMLQDREALLTEIMLGDEELGLYDA